MTNPNEIPLSPSELTHFETWLGSGSINLFGKPYAGKDTHGDFLGSLLHAPVLGAGDLLRTSSTVSPEDQADIDAGRLVSSATFFDKILPALNAPELTKTPLVLSSVGRMDGEAEPVVSALEQSNHPLRAVVHINISDEIAIGRLFAKLAKEGPRDGRTDDDPIKLIQERLPEFDRKTQPVIEYYRSQGMLIEVDGNRPKHIVSSDILSALSFYALIRG
jgi:adenylate kinase